jgi:acyl-CoA synthetase (AMP-forming)/AMP-acid ligase II
VVDESLAYLNQNVDGRREAPEYIIAEMNIEWQDSVEMHFAYPDETELAALQLTSGTTGMPRVCSWRQASVIEALDGMVSAMTLAADDIFLNWTPLYHDMGLVNNFFLCMVKRYPVVMLNPNDFVKKPSLWMRGLQDTQATQTWSPNFGFALSVQRVRDSELHGIDLSHVRGFWSAAERVHYETMVQFYERFRSFGVKREALKTNFGCAENIGGATFSDPQRSFSVEFIDREAFLNQRIAKPIGEGQENTLTVVGVGKPHRKMRIDILARNGRVLPEGHVGEVALITPSRMRGYLKDAKATQRAIKGDYLRTGDMGYLRNGELFWTGRVRERITIRGVKFDPSDLEPILFDVPGLRQGCFAAFGIDDEGIGTQRLVIITEVRNGVSAPVEQIIDDIRGRVFQTLGLSVSEVMLVRQGTLTKTSSGKRRHRFFRQEYLTGNLQDYIWAPEVIA